MRLGTRILLSYGYLATLLVVGAASAAVAFQRLGDNIGDVLGENFHSVQAGMQMLESLERQDGATLSILLGHPTARTRLQDAEASFADALEAARSNITIDREETIIEQIAAGVEAYREVRDELLRQIPEQPVAAYEDRAFPRFEQVKQKVRELIDLNHSAMQQADASAGRAATANAGLHALLVAFALLSLAPLSRSIRRHLIFRLEEIRSVSEAISEGDLGRRLNDREDDELGLAARQLNQVLDRYQELEAELSGHRSRQARMLESLLKAMPQEGVLMTRGGAVLASTVEADLVRPIREAAQRELAAMESATEISIDLEGRRARLFPLSTGDRPEVAWLAMLETRE